MSSTPKTRQKNVISLEKYRGKRQKPRGLTHEQAIGDPDPPPTARVWLQSGIPRTSFENISPENATQLLLMALSMCIELAVMAHESNIIQRGIDISS